ncbi:MAG: hypothetical protein PVH68_10530 [Armatimonadota bacterium]|jgi:hypothetical protein
MSADRHLCISGIYPHLTAHNQPEPGKKDMTHGEAGIGAIVPWAGRLWYITYPQHKTTGSNDKLYEVDEQLNLTVRPESVGGTHASRMVHRESNQLIIGPYFIDAERNVRATDLQELRGRMTAAMRHLTDPANKVYFFDMEGAIYEVDVHSLEVTRLFDKPVPGWHGKGAYTAQGRVVIANNGERGRDDDREYLVGGPPQGEEAGILAEWDGKQWHIVERKQFLDVTGPGGINGSPDDNAPLWAMGWDARSIILKLLDGGAWHTFRLPKGSHTFDPRHGWFTEWPRIREIEPGRPMMCVHGTMFDFPIGFSAASTAGIRPICTHLRYIPDFCHWNGRVILGADDASMMANPLCGQPQSNLWFGTREGLERFGPRAGWGGVWMDDAVRAGEPSVPFLLAGYEQRVLHLAHDADQPVTFSLEIDRDGRGEWSAYREVQVPGGGYSFHVFPEHLLGEWIRVAAGRDCTATAYFHYWTPRSAGGDETKLFAALADPGGPSGYSAGIVRPSAVHRGLEWVSQDVDRAGETKPTVFKNVKLDGTRALAFSEPEEDRSEWLKEVGTPTQDFDTDGASVIVKDVEGRRWRLPKGPEAFDGPFPTGWPRGVREAVSERYLANIHGTLYEVPRTGGRAVPDWAQVKPVCTHNKLIADLCTWRGLLVISGTRTGAQPDGQFFAGEDGQGLWFGTIDDLWKLGKPVGRGGPWRETQVEAGEPSDPYLMTGFDRKTLELSHDADGAVQFLVQVRVTPGTTWAAYDRLAVAPGRRLKHEFPSGYHAHWMRVTANRACRATAWLTYE